MMASELYRQLGKLLDKHGDREIKMFDNGCGGHYNCDPYQPVDEVTLYTEACTGDEVIRIESQW